MMSICPTQKQQKRILSEDNQNAFCQLPYSAQKQIDAHHQHKAFYFHFREGKQIAFQFHSEMI
jgi:hypothetical protein